MADSNTSLRNGLVMAAAIMAATWITLSKTTTNEPADYFKGVAAGATVLYAEAQTVFIQEPS
ncbi:MAG: hypothetical protein OXE02_08210 [Chloroflexi bacterium]|nr:hypothetical protein [Chloroflexota bacterium]